jgi:hypothetical protein
VSRFGTGPNFRVVAFVSAVAAVVFYVVNSQTVPVSGRRRFNFLSDTIIEHLGQQGADEVLEDLRVSGRRMLPEWDPRTIAVRRVMKRLVPVSGMADVDWQIHVIDDEGTQQLFLFLLPALPVSLAMTWPLG